MLIKTTYFQDPLQIIPMLDIHIERGPVKDITM